MNLKESFRYQNFLDSLMRSAAASIMNREHCLKVTKTHHRNKANPEVQDIVEEVEVDAYFDNDDVIRFMLWLVEQREKLTSAITRAKAAAGIDIDAAVEANKFRQTVNSAITTMLGYKPTKRIESGRDYKFNAEGNQMPYVYEVEVVSEAAYDKEKAKQTMLAVSSESDSVSAAIDAAMINTVVEYEPTFNVNESFEDVLSAFIAEPEQ